MTKHTDGMIINPSTHDWRLLKEIVKDKCFDDNDFYIRHALNSIPIAITELILDLNKRVEELEFSLKQLEEEKE